MPTSVSNGGVDGSGCIPEGMGVFGTSCWILDETCKWEDVGEILPLRGSRVRGAPSTCAVCVRETIEE